ncbi:MAG TPA: class I SAM-dependent methyltransferase [Microlunatus sp.]|nr:class I SAM-dependent methyltransferase [Microlunatus sp.]
MTTTRTDRPTTRATDVPVDPDRLMAFVLRAVDEVGATLNCALVTLGDQLGYYRDLAQHGPTTPSELAERTATPLPYVREWLSAQAAGSYLRYDAGSGRFTLSPEVAVAMTDESSPAFLPGFFQIALGTVRDADRVIAAARTGQGVGWHEHDADVHLGCERFFRPGYEANLLTSWLPALDGVAEKLSAGVSVADVGCGHGASTVLMAQAYGRSRFVGSDYHAASIAVARERAAAAGLESNISFEVASATGITGTGFELVTMFDCLHDMGDPAAAARRVREVIADDGTWMVVEPAAGDALEDNLNPIGRAYYGFSTLLCTPASLSQPGAAALGTQAGPARIAEVARDAGFSRFRTAAQTPFNNVYEIRP